ncbi:outer membrane beta-barrel family protein [Telluribacter sp. SYSU D00476]|uniref:outer membrane beta-barrel family protein n=1 Tax=Telluribacter sp. SYSU D00476 TaxID=2811430 RepID=UPI001FF51B80|nr:outer membrane beta-barrel family protein [Telluribacter sp. SYSU D00476]
MKKLSYLLPLLLYWLCAPALAQTPAKVSIRGAAVDSASHPLDGATVMLLSGQDSSLVSFARSQSNGGFEFKNVDNRAYLLQITYVGLQKYTQPLDVQPTPTLDLGTLHLLPVPKDLSEVLIKGERAPVQIKQDTIEYNAGSFKVQPNAVVEDLLKRLPGVEVERDGTVRAQGQQVQRVTVDGKEFFGRDPKIATRNLPADAIEKVQVLDRKSDQAQFTGIDDGQREKTINLTLKEEKKNLTFGNLTAGAGPDNRYSLRGNLNRFSKTKQLSLLGMGNNVNQQGFSMDDYMNFTGAAQRMMSGQRVLIQINGDEDTEIPLNFGGRTNGYLTNWAGGVNFNNQITPKTEINGSYFYNQLGQDIGQLVNRQTFLPNRTFSSTQNTAQHTGNTTHRGNLVLDQKIDSSNSFRWTNRFDYRQNNAAVTGESRAFAGNGELENEGVRTTFSQNDGIRLNSELLLRHQFRKKGRTLSSTLTFGLDQNDRNGTLNATNRFFDGDSAVPTRIDTLRQQNEQTNDRQNYGVTLSYTEPIAKRKYLELNYAWQKALNDVDRRVYDLGGEGLSRRLNQQLSNQFHNSFTYQRGGFNLRTNQKKYNGSIGLSVQQSSLRGELVRQDVDINRSFLNALPNARFQYNLGDTRNLNLTYDTDVREPGIQQLAPVVDNTDPLNIYEGNPSLRPEYNHRFTLRYFDFNALRSSNLFGFLNFTYTANRITDSQQIDERLVRTFRPVNVRNDYTFNGDVSKGFRIRPINTRVSVSTNLLYNRSITPVNNIDNQTRRLVSRNTLRLEYRYKEVFDIAASARLTYNQTAYSLNTSLNQRFTNQNYDIEANWHIGKVIHLSSTLDYAIYNFPDSDFSQRVPIWNASVAHAFLKNKRGELKLSAVDLLNRNVVINRVAQANFVQDEQIRSLQRYFLLSFTYSLGAKPKPQMRGFGG